MALIDADRRYMQIALREARKGVGRTSPNPCVGAVIVKDGEIVATGYHKKAGKPHAEINALKRAGNRSEGATMYVTLEPCNHTGRTPPCSHAVAASGIKRVVIGMLDPNPLVDGSGADYLRDRGIDVEHGLLEEKCIELNRGFLKYIETGRPLVIMKAGISLDGRISYQQGEGGAITGPESLRQVHLLRDRTDAILVGIGTVAVDDPSLTTRLASRNGKDPVRVILDSTLRIDENARVLHVESDAPCWIFCSETADAVKGSKLESAGARLFRIGSASDGRLDLAAMLDVLGSHSITSLLVEGGARVHGAFLRAGLVDRAHLFYAPLLLGDGGTPLIQDYSTDGGKSAAIRLANTMSRRLGEDMLITGDVVYPG